MRALYSYTAYTAYTVLYGDSMALHEQESVYPPRQKSQMRSRRPRGEWAVKEFLRLGLLELYERIGDLQGSLERPQQTLQVRLGAASASRPGSKSSVQYDVRFP